MNDTDAASGTPGLASAAGLRVMLHPRWSEIENTISLLADLQQFVHDHRQHGGLTGDARRSPRGTATGWSSTAPAG